MVKNMMIGTAIGAIVLLVVKSDQMQPSSRPNAGSVPTVVTETKALSYPVTTVSNAVSEIESSAEQLPTEPAAENQFAERPGLLKQLLRESIEEAQYVTPTADELAGFEQLLLMTLQRRTECEKLSGDWSRLGWDLQYWASHGDRFAAICEHPDRRRGRGIYVIRVDSASRIALQAPHRFYDANTGLLTRKLFERGDVLLAAWNTVHRDQVDLAHQSEHFINAVTRALIRLDDDIVVAQLHGFDQQKRKSGASAAEMIISDTTRYPGRLVHSVVVEQKKLFGGEAVKLYPTEVSELGGTLNQQAAVFHSFGRSGFLHLELSQQMRAKLTSDASVRGQFFSALTSAAADWQDLRSR